MSAVCRRLLGRMPSALSALSVGAYEYGSWEGFLQMVQDMPAQARRLHDPGALKRNAR